MGPADTGRKLNVHQTFRRRPERLLNVLRMFNLRPVSTGEGYSTEIRYNMVKFWFYYPNNSGLSLTGNPLQFINFWK